jgi:predicted RND superfamily exporter protein
MAGASEKKPVWTILAIVAITAFALAGTVRIHQEYGYKTMLPKDKESVLAIDEIESGFGGLAKENVLVVADDVLRPDVLRRVAGYGDYLRSMDGQEGRPPLWDNLITGVDTLLDQMYLLPAEPAGTASGEQAPQGTEPQAEGGTGAPAGQSEQLQPLADHIASLTDEELLRQVEANIALNQQQAQAMGMTGGFREYLSADRKAQLITVRLNPSLNAKEQIRLAEPFRDGTSDYFREPQGLSVYVNGAATMNRDSNQTMMKDTSRLFLLAFLFILLILYITFRRVSDVLLTLMVIVVTVIWVMGLSGWLNFPFTYSSSGIMPLLLGIDIAYAIHVMSRYYEERKGGSDPREATITSVTTVGVAVFLTAATTAFGFASFGISDMPPIQQFGALCVAGVVFSFILAVTLLPAAVVLRDRGEKAQARWNARNRKREEKAGFTWLDRTLARLAVLSEHHRLTVGLVTLAVLAACVALSFNLSTESDMEKMMPSDTPSAVAQKEITHYFGGQDQGVALVKADDVLDPGVLRSMLDYEDMVSSTGERNEKGEPLIERQKVFSIADLVARANNGELPDTKLGVQEVLIKLGSGKSGSGNRMISEDRKTAMLNIMVSRGSQEDMKRITEIMRDSASRVSGQNPSVSITCTGLPVLMTDIMGSLVPTQLKTSGLALLLCALIVILVFKSVFFGLAATSVVFISIAVELGALVLLGWPLDFMTVMISSLVIGAGIDFGIHVTHRFREEWHHGGEDVDEAIRRTVAQVGRALLAAAVTTAGAFAIIATSNIAFMRRFGGITALSLMVALLASLLVLPSILASRAYAVERKNGGKKGAGAEVDSAP